MVLKRMCVWGGHLFVEHESKTKFFPILFKNDCDKSNNNTKKNSQAKHYDLYSHKLKRIDIKRKNEAEKNNKTTK